MHNVRVIARLDVKGQHLIKGIQLEGLRKIGDPNEHAIRYYEQGADELIYMDCVASLYGRNSLVDIVKRTSNDVFIPVTVGGGIRSVEDAREILRAGADKVAINTAAIGRPELIEQMSQEFGSQCMVISIEAKRVGENKWEAYYDNGRERTGMDVVAWAVEAAERGAGELLLTSVDMEGTARGFDVELVARVNEAVNIPLIASGGMGKVSDLLEVIKTGNADAVAMAHVLHYNELTIGDIRAGLLDAGIKVRTAQ